ncbi:Hypothetical predicted protein, partial [Podarcis lilfordi]
DVAPLDLVEIRLLHEAGENHVDQARCILMHRSFSQWERSRRQPRYERLFPLLPIFAS